LKKFSFLNVVVAAIVLAVPYAASAQQETRFVVSPHGTSSLFAESQQTNVPVPAQRAADAAERAARRFRMGVEGGVGLDPELIMVGVHGTFAPVFHRSVAFRPGVELGFGEVTTAFGVNLDVLYTLPGSARGSKWVPYVGAGPNFGLSHRGFELDNGDLEDNDRNRLDFGDTDFEGGINFIAGARADSGMFMELKATAYGVSNVKLLVGVTF
jgi:hypothetical protein